MNRFIARAAQTVRQVFTVDQATSRFLEKTYVDVALTSRFGGN
jgi:hypothetical protein